MKQIIIQTQKEFDRIKDNFEGLIIIRDTKEYISINRSFNNGYVSVYGNATIESISGNATIKYVYDNATIKYVYGNSPFRPKTKTKRGDGGEDKWNGIQKFK